MNSYTHYVVNFDPFAFRFPDGFFVEGVRWYGLAYIAGFAAAFFLACLYHKKGKSPLSNDDTLNLLTYMLFGVIIGGRLGYMLLYDFDAFAANPLLFFQIWKGGMASHGGFIGAIVAGAIYSRYLKTSFWTVADIVTSTCPVGILLGRIANFVNGELWGKISDCPWAMIFPNSMPSGTPLADIPARHPSQLYEAGLEGLFLLAYMQFRVWKFNLPKGQVTGEFFVVYAIVRIVCEIFREPDFGVTLIFGLSRGTFFSIITLLVGVCIIVYSRFRAKAGA